METANYFADILLKSTLIVTGLMLLFYTAWLVIYYGSRFVKKILKPKSKLKDFI